MNPGRWLLAAGAIALASAALIAGCGGNVAPPSASGATGGSTSGGTSTYTIGGNVSGLAAGTTLVLQDNGGDNLSITANGAFRFATALANGAGYSVTVLTQPAGQICGVTSGSGAIAGANVTNVAISCVVSGFGSSWFGPSTLTVGGNVSGLAAGTTLVLQDNGGDNLSITANGAFTFATALANGAAYNVTVLTQPAGQTCAVAGGSGTLAGANVTNVAVTCAAARFAFVGNWTSNDVSAYTISPTTGLLTSVGPPAPAGTNPVFMAAHPSAMFLYVANFGSNNISAYSINATTGVLTQIAGSPFAAGTGTYGVAITPTGTFLYAANETANTISAFAINGTTGALSAVAGSPFAAAAGATWARALVVDPTGKFLFVANGSSNNVTAYTINATTGALTAVGSVAAGTTPYAITADPTGKFVYVVNQASNNVSAYTINAVTGALTSVGAAAPTGGSNPLSATIDPTGKYLYVANQATSNISAFSINATTGALTAITGSPFAAGGTWPRGIAINAAGTMAYIPNQASNTVSTYGIGATGALSAATSSSGAGTAPIPVVLK